MDFCFVHAADLHLDSPFAGIGSVAPAVAERLRNASLEAFDCLIAFTIERGAQFLLLAGDIYDKSQRGVRAQLRFYKGMERLAAANIPVYAAYGNHDHLDGWSAVREWPSNVHFFAPGEPQALKLTAHGQLLATIYGTSYACRETTENLALRYRRDRDEGLHIGVLHCNLGGPTDDAYSACSLEDLARTRMDYWALGHLHKHAVLCSGDPWVVYPGCLQGGSLKESEQGEKGAVVAGVRESRVTDVQLVPLDRVRFLPLRIDIADVADLPALCERLQREADALQLAASGRHVVVRAILTGRGALHGDLARQDRTSELLAELRAEFEGRDPILFWEDVRDETCAGIDRAAIARRGDFSAEVVRYADELLAQPDMLGAFAKEQFAPLDKPRLRKSLAELDAPDPAQLLREASDLAMELLEEGNQA